ncbi:putative glycolipid-binding domain-containing protein [Streptomyces sp. NPDC006879]|uniref:putative glycolipid-binding domain-containing protein n=1 Tax=Streptomyces sp. NPDC006879 TaxID=3364767 RepID=UPI0036AA4A09
MIVSRVLTWEVVATGGYETAWTEREGTVLRARGRAVGTGPEPYWVSYKLETGEDFVTRRLRVTVERAAGTEELGLRRDEAGRWTAAGEPLPQLDGALDCDLGLCPLTNTMPVLRHELHRSGGDREFLVAWVSVPELSVVAATQRYSTVEQGESGALIRFESGTFRRDIEFDTEGMVLDYPGLARRIDTRLPVPPLV